MTLKYKLTVTGLNGDGSLKSDCHVEYDKFGSYDIGRGDPKLNISEKKCSRKQITIKINENNTFFITSNGVNPSYLKKFNNNTFTQMNKEQEYKIDDSDCVSLLFETHTFILRLVPNSPSDSDLPNSFSKRKLAEIKLTNDDSDEHEKKKFNNKKLECPFGENCYRKNDEHFEEFSHPVLPNKTTPIQPIQPKVPVSTDNTIKKNTTKQNDKVSQAPLNITKPQTNKPPSLLQRLQNEHQDAENKNKSNNNNNSNNNDTTSDNSTTTNTNKFIGAKYKKRKLNDVNKKRTLVFPLISTSTFGFDIEKAIQVAGKTIAEYLEFHSPIENGEDDIRLKMLVESNIYSDEIIDQFKKIFNDKWDPRFSIIKVNSQLPNQVFSSNSCRLYATETTWRLKKTPQNKILYDDLLGGNQFEEETKKLFPIGKSGKVYPVPLNSDTPFRKEYGVDNVILILGPNMNPNKPDCLKDYSEAVPLLTETYQQLFNALDVL